MLSVITLSCFLLLYTVGLQALTITYNPEETCAVKGSTIVLTCSYPPTRQYFRRGHWYRHDSRTSASDAGRFVLSSASKDCILKLDGLTSSHFYEHRVETSYYPMSMSTNVETGPGRANLTVVDTLRKDCWGVSYGSVTDICLLEGSTLDIPCSYGFPRGHTVATAFWYRREKKKDPTDLRDIEQYKGRVEYLGADDIHNCTVRIRDLGLNDSWQYHFRYTTDKPGGAFSGGPVNILVTDLQVSMSSDTVTEGDNVTMSCSTRCKLKGNTTFIWYKDNMTPIKTSSRHPSTSSSLHLDPVSSEDAGQYYCAIEGQEDVTSSAATLHNENNMVTLTCISDANPPVHTYTWYRKDGGNITLLGVGQTHVVVSNSSEISGFYYCVAQNDIGWKISELLSLPTSGKAS
ncbi:sialoadhesin-like [Engraulis encrasicolus]|uniref:sialoadhesin-like n=1 Tax=Engraulis encrasicolus TaxID=184585 RepID=UPI002FD2F0CD